MKKRFLGVDILRILFAYIIFFHHINVFCGLNNQFSKTVAFVVNNFAVAYFFVVSGYFFAEKILLNTHQIKLITCSYIKKIGSMYLIWTGIMLLFRIPEIIKIGINAKGQALYWLKYLRVVFFIGEWSLWYLLGLLQAIIIFCIFFRKKNIGICCSVALILFMLGLIVSFFPEIVKNTVYSNIYDIYFFVFGTLRNGIFVGYTYFMIGILSAYREIQLSHKKIIIVIVFSLFYCLTYMGGGLLFAILTQIAVGIIFRLSISKSSQVKSTVLRDFSSLLYLSHICFIRLFLVGGMISSFWDFLGMTVLMHAFLIMVLKLSNRYKVLRIIY